MYNYETQKASLFTDEGQRMFLKIRDKVNKLLDAAGAFTQETAMRGITGDAWDMTACIDRLEELVEIREVGRSGPFLQHRVFVRGGS